MLVKPFVWVPFVNHAGREVHKVAVSRRAARRIWPAQHTYSLAKALDIRIDLAEVAPRRINHVFCDVNHDIGAFADVVESPAPQALERAAFSKIWVRAL